ncbi:MAG: sigma-70 family RNA polymerase sigma factor [Reichenbachiella sp.]|uniref:RNA polymerase sigma factor n=1 Tax=Reichenbachiella sp. TaxID=2184521 RepID=UPI003267DC8D
MEELFVEKVKSKDSVLWRLFLNGDRKAFDEIYRNTYKKLRNYGYQFTNNQTLIEDVIQDLFVDLENSRKRLSDTTAIMPYLYTAFRRKIIKTRDRELKKICRTQEQFFEIELSKEHLLIEEEIKNEKESKVKLAVSALNDKEREIIYFYFYEDLTYEQIRLIIGYENVKSVRNKMYKIFDLMRARFLVLPQKN